MNTDPSMANKNENPGVQNYPKDEYEDVKQQNFDKFLSFLQQNFDKVVGGVLSCQNHFEAQDSDILLSTFPKCGTTLMKALIFTLINRKIHSPLSVPYLEMDLFGSNEVPDLSSFRMPRLFATRAPFGLLPKSVLESKCKLVYICRNSKDTFISFWCFLQKSQVRNLCRTLVVMFCNGINFFWTILGSCVGLLESEFGNPDKVLFMTYEELQREPSPLLVRRLADFLRYSFSGEEEDSGMVDATLKLCIFENLSSLEVNSSGSTKLITGVENKVLFRKGEVGDWKNHLSVEMANQIVI